MENYSGNFPDQLCTLGSGNPAQSGTEDSAIASIHFCGTAVANQNDKISNEGTRHADGAVAQNCKYPRRQIRYYERFSYRCDAGRTNEAAAEYFLIRPQNKKRIWKKNCAQNELIMCAKIDSRRIIQLFYFCFTSWKYLPGIFGKILFFCC